MDDEKPLAVRILALGSPHGDDQVGWKIAERLVLDPHVAPYVHSLTTPWELVDHVTPDCSVIVIDGCRGAAQPGSVVTCQESELSHLSTRDCSTHGGSLLEAVELARRLDRPIRELVVVAVEIEACRPETELSESALAGIDVAVQMVREKLAEWKMDDLSRNRSKSAPRTKHA